MLFGAAGLTGAAVVSACSGQGGMQTAGPSTSGAAGMGKPDGRAAVLIARFDQNEFAKTGSPQRLVFSLGASDRTASAEAPEALDISITSGGQPVGEPLRATRHNDGVPISYFPVTFTPPQPGTYQAATTLNGQEATVAFKVSGNEIKVPQIGEKLVPVETPTTTDPHGVDPICTRKPSECPFHTSTLTEAMASGKPVALLISTPEFCQIGVCGPVLQLLMDQQAKNPEFAYVHAEVFRNRMANDATDVIKAYHLTYEPSLFVAKPDGTIVDRLDFVFDRTEIASALKRVL